MKTTHKLFFILMLLFTFNVKAATLIFDNGFESGNLTGFKPHLMYAPYATFSIISSPIASGTKSGKLDLVKTSSSLDTYRAETQIDKGIGNFKYNVEYWIGFNYRFEDWAKDYDSEFAPLQVHLRPSSWTCELGSAWSNAPFYMWVSNDIMNFNSWPGKNRWSAPIQKNKWLSLVIRFIPSWGSNGVIEAWLNGTKIVSVFGQNHPQLDGCNNNHLEPYFNLGVYKWNWRINRPLTQSSRRTLLFDNLKIASGSGGYSTVTTPISGSTTPTPTPTPVVFQLSNITATPSAVSSIITWNTSLTSDTTVEYGKTTAYGLVASGASSTLNHSVKLIDLAPGTVYHYRVKSKNSDGLLLTSTDKTFTTSLSTLSGLESDNFDGALNTSIWEFYNPAGDSSTSNDAGIQSIINPSGAAHDLNVGNLNAPRIRQVTANTDMTLEVKLRSNPTQKYQSQGITVEQDNNNLLRFDILKSGSGTLAYGGLISSNGTVFTEKYRVLISNPSNTYWLKVTRFGNVWTSYYSQNGTDWTQVATFTQTLTAAKVGIHSINAGTPPPAFTALVDYFKADNVEPPPPVTEPPVISNIVLTPGKNSIDYSYTTDTASSTKSIHNFSCSTSIGSINNDPALVTSHSGSLTGLIAETPYRIQFCSTDSGGRERCSANQTATTTE